MPFELLNLNLLLPGLMVVLFRIIGMSMAAPLFSSTTIPRRVKIAFALALSLMIYPAVQPTLPKDLTVAQALTGVVGELMVGLGIGFCLSLVFVATQVSGLMIAQQAGLALGRVFNPELNTSTTPIGQLFFLVLMGIFLGLNGHVAFVQAVLESFTFIPPLEFRVTSSTVELIIAMLTSAFVLAVRLAGPGLTALFLVTMAMGFISRTVPQLNILAVGFSIRSATALTMTAVTITVAQDVLVNGIVDFMEGVELFLRGPG